MHLLFCAKDGFHTDEATDTVVWALAVALLTVQFARHEKSWCWMMVPCLRYLSRLNRTYDPSDGAFCYLAEVLSKFTWKHGIRH